MVELGPQMIALPVRRGRVLGISNSLSPWAAGGPLAPLFHCLGAGLCLCCLGLLLS